LAAGETWNGSDDMEIPGEESRGIVPAPTGGKRKDGRPLRTAVPPARSGEGAPECGPGKTQAMVSR
jgi:hypothetical protein